MGYIYLILFTGESLTRQSFVQQGKEVEAIFFQQCEGFLFFNSTNTTPCVLLSVSAVTSLSWPHLIIST